MPPPRRERNFRAQLNQAEEDVATGDLFAWTYDTIRQFKAGYHVDIPTIGQPVQSDVDLIPNFPYKQINFSLDGHRLLSRHGKICRRSGKQVPAYAGSESGD